MASDAQRRGRVIARGMENPRAGDYRPSMRLPRITQPLVRDHGSLRPASWEEALDRAAGLLRAAVGRHGPSTFGLFSCSKATNEVNFMAQKFARVAIGSNNIDSCNRT
jgi:formate dehydrogenase major subunit